MIVSCPVHGSPPNPHLLRVEARCLPLHPLLKLDEPGKNRGLLINRLRVRETLLSRLLPGQQEVSSFTSRKPRSGQALRPPPEPHLRGSLSFCWTASLCLQPPVCECGRKARVVGLLRPWPRVFFFPTTCMLLRTSQRSSWGAG